MNVLVHVPHASPRIPADVRADLAVDDVTLTRELAAMTDWLTAPLALAACAGLPISTWVNPWSRLVVDPERLPAEREEMAALGMGAVYATRHDGGRLRHPDARRDEALLAQYFTPYAQGLSQLVTDDTVIVDVHSFPSKALPYELMVHGDRPRPALCIGTDDFHTPDWLVDLVRDAWATHVGGEVGINEPFAGTYVPLEHWGSNADVRSIMI